MWLKYTVISFSWTSCCFFKPKQKSNHDIKSIKPDCWSFVKDPGIFRPAPWKVHSGDSPLRKAVTKHYRAIFQQKLAMNCPNSKAKAIQNWIQAILMILVAVELNSTMLDREVLLVLMIGCLKGICDSPSLGLWIEIQQSRRQNHIGILNLP